MPHSFLIGQDLVKSLFKSEHNQNNSHFLLSFREMTCLYFAPVPFMVDILVWDCEPVSLPSSASSSARILTLFDSNPKPEEEGRERESEAVSQEKACSISTSCLLMRRETLSSIPAVHCRRILLGIWVCCRTFPRMKHMQDPSLDHISWDEPLFDGYGWYRRLTMPNHDEQAFVVLQN